MAAKKKIKQADNVLTASEQLSSFLKTHKEDHYNYEEAIEYKISTGSLTLDIETGGGLGPGLHRFCGINEGGKTSEALEVARHFLKMPNSRAVYFKCEGRLTPEMRERCGVDFVHTADPESWKDGTCFIYESNIYESVFDMMKMLIQFNEEGKRYIFILDSVDGLQTKGDSEKALHDATKVAGGATISSVFMKKVATALTKRGHMAIFISQVRADIQLDPYSKAPIRQTSATGGNALLHFANWILEFEARFKKDYILEDDKKATDRVTNKILGQWSKVTVKKSPNEKTNVVIAYPIKRGRVGGTSIWKELEIVDLLIQYEFVTKAGAWIKVSPDIVEELASNKIDIPEKFQGKNGLFNFLEDNQPVTDYFYNKFKEVLS
jgi:RecA/RadA recombinase